MGLDCLLPGPEPGDQFTMLEFARELTCRCGRMSVPTARSRIRSGSANPVGSTPIPTMSPSSSRGGEPLPTGELEADVTDRLEVAVTNDDKDAGAGGNKKPLIVPLQLPSRVLDPELREAVSGAVNASEHRAGLGDGAQVSGGTGTWIARRGAAGPRFVHSKGD